MKRRCKNCRLYYNTPYEKGCELNGYWCHEENYCEYWEHKNRFLRIIFPKKSEEVETFES